MIRRRCAILSASISAANRRRMGRFRDLLEQHDLGRRLFDEVHRYLADKGLKMATATIVDSRAVVDQECQQGARSGDASNQEKATSGISE
jgi:IS5 family transposase